MSVNSTRRRAADAVDLSGSSSVVTGATSWIALTCALRLASAGAKVTVVGRDRATVENVADEISGHARLADLADPQALDELVDLAADIVVNNAGVQRVAPVR